MGIQAAGDTPYNRATRETAEHVRAVREAVGPDVDIAVDVHAKFFEAERAIRLAKAIEPYNPFWMEESVRPENYDAMKKVADHVSIPLATAINVHFAASTPNFLILEYSAPDSGARKDVLKEPLMVKKDGYVDIPNKPGWGVELNEEAFKRMPPSPWRRGTNFHADGSPYFQ